MSLATILQRLAGSSGQTKADAIDPAAQQLLDQLAAKERECAAKDAEIRAIVTRHGLSETDGSDELQQLIDKMQEDQLKAQDLEADLETLMEEQQDIANEIDEYGLEYPYGLDLQYI